MIDPDTTPGSGPSSSQDDSGLSATDVRKLARLARIRLAEDPDQEPWVVDGLLHDLRGVLGHIDRLQTLDVDGVEPMTRPEGSLNRLDPDTPGPVLDAETLLAAAPLVEGPFIAVPKVLADGS